MKDKKDEEFSKKFWYFLLAIFVIFIIFVSIGFVFFANREEKVIEKNETGGNVTLNYTNNITGLSLKKIIPTTDAVAMKDLTDDNYFDFFIDVDLKNANYIEYEISAIKRKNECTITNDDIRIYLEKEKSGTYTMVFGPSKYVPITKESKLGSEKGSMILIQSKAVKSTKDNYRLRMWLSDTSLIPMGDYAVDVVVNGIAK